MIIEMINNKHVTEYLRQIGKKGGLKSRRNLSSETARLMVQLREARRVFKRFKVSCFWSTDPATVIRSSDIPWLIDTLKRNGDRRALIAAQALENYAKGESDATN